MVKKNLVWVIYTLAVLIIGYTITGAVKTGYAENAKRLQYTPTLQVYKDPNRSVYCYKDSWSGISVALSCVYVPPVVSQK